MRNVRKSYPEAVVGEYLALFFDNDIYYNYKGFEWNRSKKGGLFEYDIYIPSLSLAIEYDGEYFHSDDKLENDKEKSRLAEEHNITLLRIRESKAPDIEGNVIKTSNNYTIGNFQDLFLELNKWFSNHYSINFDYFGASAVNKLMVKTARKMNMMNDKINKFCNDLQIFIQQNPNQRIVKDSYIIDKEGNKNNISHRYYSLRSDKIKGYLTDDEVNKIASIYPPFLEGQKEMVGLRNDDKWYQYLTAYKEYWEIHKSNPGNDNKNAALLT